MSDWQPIETAPKDGTTIWVAFRGNIYPTLAPGRYDLARFNGRQAPLMHTGLTKTGQDFGWTIALPVGVAGFPDEWIAGWQPLPPPPAGE